jgi:tRNA threonylcarbamoyladenosine biosynthesis protein TsaB
MWNGAMNVLAFDTCFGAVSAAVGWKSARGEWLLREAFEPLAVGHAERLLPMIDEVMAGAGLDYGQLDRIAVTVGPGGFTGLRAGVAVARALALATGRPVVGLSSLAVMAARANFLLGAHRGQLPLVIAVDARRSAFYMQTFGENSGDALSEPALVEANDLVAHLPEGACLIAGSGAKLVCAAAARLDLEVVLPDLVPHARQLALLAPVLKPMHPVTPLYLRAADAKPPSTQPLSRKP